jgi:excisionase family DNA binding protein
MNTTTQFFNSEEAAQVLGVNVQTMRKYLRSGKVRGLRLGRDWRISGRALDELAHKADNQPKAPASTPDQNGGNPLASASALADELAPAIAAGASGGTFNAADELNAMRQERDRDLSGA